MDKETITGGCYCGAIRYKASRVPKYSGVCYCNDCRKIAGAQSVAWITFFVEDFEYTKGGPVRFQSSEHVTRAFCGTCGTCLSYQNDNRKSEIDLTMASLDDPEKYPPRNLVFPDEKLSWDVHLNLPRFNDL